MGDRRGGRGRDGLRKESEYQSLEKLSSLPPLIRVKNTLPSLYRSLTPTTEEKRWSTGRGGAEGVCVLGGERSLKS